MTEPRPFNEAARSIFSEAVLMLNLDGPFGEEFIESCLSGPVGNGIVTSEIYSMKGFEPATQHKAEWDLFITVAKALTGVKTRKDLTKQLLDQVWPQASEITLKIVNAVAEGLLKNEYMLSVVAERYGGNIENLELSTLKAKVESNHNPKI